jgi:hypothetical protein
MQFILPICTQSEIFVHVEHKEENSYHYHLQILFCMWVDSIFCSSMSDNAYCFQELDRDLNKQCGKKDILQIILRDLQNHKPNIIIVFLRMFFSITTIRYFIFCFSITIIPLLIGWAQSFPSIVQQWSFVFKHILFDGLRLVQQAWALNLDSEFNMTTFTSYTFTGYTPSFLLLFLCLKFKKNMFLVTFKIFNYRIQILAFYFTSSIPLSMCILQRMATKRLLPMDILHQIWLTFYKIIVCKFPFFWINFSKSLFKLQTIRQFKQSINLNWLQKAKKKKN